MRNLTLMLTHPEASRERLLAMVRLIPGAHMGIKVAALLLILEGQRPGWIADVLGLTRQSLNLWMHRWVWGGRDEEGACAFRTRASMASG